MEKTLKLYVWTGFSPDYTSGLAVAIASSETDARRQIIKCHGYNPDDWGELSVRPLNKRCAFSVSGGG